MTVIAEALFHRHGESWLSIYESNAPVSLHRLISDLNGLSRRFFFSFQRASAYAVCAARPHISPSSSSSSSSSFSSRLWGFGEKSVKALVSCYGNSTRPPLPPPPLSSRHQGPQWCFDYDVTGELLEPCLLRKITHRQGNNAENNFFSRSQVQACVSFLAVWTECGMMGALVQHG